MTRRLVLAMALLVAVVALGERPTTVTIRTRTYGGGRKGADGSFLWPGFGDNARVLQWLVRRIEGLAESRPSAIGDLPLSTRSVTDHRSGRIYLAAGKYLWATELYIFDYIDPTKNFLQFEKPQELRLDVDGEIADFVEKERSALGFLE